MLDDVLARHLVADHQLSHREYEVLVRLDGHGGRLRMSALAQQIVASGALVTQTMLRLEDRGFVERQPAESGDRRGVDAVILEAGRVALESSAAPHAEIIQQLLLERVGVDRLESFAAAMDDVANHLRSHRSGASCDDEDCPALRYA